MKLFGYKNLIVNSLWFSSEKIILLIANFFGMIFLANNYIVSDVSDYFLTLNLFLLFVAATGPGYEALIHDLFIQDLKKRKYLLAESISLKVLLLAFVSLVVFAISFLFESNINIFLKIMSFAMFGQFFYSLETYFLGIGKYKIFAVPKIKIMLFFSATRALLLYFQFNLVIIFTIFLVEAIVLFCFCFFLLNKLKIRFNLFEYKIINLRKFDLLNLGLKDFLLYVLRRADFFIVSILMPVDKVAIYGITIRIIEIAQMLAATFSANLYNRQKLLFMESYSRKTTAFYSKFLYFGILVALINYFAVDIYFPKLFKEDYLEGIYLIKAFSLLIPFIFLFNISWRFDLHTNSNSFLLKKIVFGAFLQSVLGYIFILNYGIYGGVISFLTVHILVFICSNLIFKVSRENFFYQINAFNPLNLIR